MPNVGLKPTQIHSRHAHDTAKTARGRQHKPTRSEVAAAWGRLRDAASEGSIQASALLIALAENKLVIAMESPAA